MRSVSERVFSADRCFTAALLASALCLSPACGPALDEPMESASPTAASGDELAADNGLTANGLVTNGLVTNGLVTNGLVTNGLVTNGLSTASFQAWFNASDASYAAMVMRYLVACGLASGQSLAWTNPVTGASYAWPGVLGLTPGWASGHPATESEQQVMTACLAAHVNKYGRHVQISINGAGATGRLIGLAPGEAKSFAVPEAAFFGNLFNGEGVYVAASRKALSPAESTVRACGLSTQEPGASTECSPMMHVGMAKDFCQLDASKSYYVGCTYQGKTYKPLTTRIRHVDVYKCGDGICQFTESCGAKPNSNRYDSCGLDCGVCNG